MPKYTFYKPKDKDNHFDRTEVAIICDTESLDDLLEAFKEFLLACSFHIPNGAEIEIIENE